MVSYVDHNSSNKMIFEEYINKLFHPFIKNWVDLKPSHIAHDLGYVNSMSLRWWTCGKCPHGNFCKKLLLTLMCTDYVSHYWQLLLGIAVCYKFLI